MTPPALPAGACPSLSAWSGEFLDQTLEAQYRRYHLPTLRRVGYAMIAIILLAATGYLPLDFELPYDHKVIVLPLRLLIIGSALCGLALLLRGGSVRYCEFVIGCTLGTFFSLSTIILYDYPVSDLYILARSLFVVAFCATLWPGSARLGLALNTSFMIACSLLTAFPRTVSLDHPYPAPPFLALILPLVLAGALLFRRSLQRAGRQDYQRLLRERRLGAELDQKRREAEAAVRAKSDFLASMSHEIRTPMNGILGMLKLALQRPMDDTLREDLTTAHRAAGDLLILLNSILDYSKLERGMIEREKVPFDLPALVTETVDSAYAPALTKGLRLGVILPSALPNQVRGDPGKLRLVLGHLISNAVKFTESGEILVEASALGGRDTGADAELVEFSVADTGIGIDQAGQRALFQPFSQVDGSSARRFGGAGLGLAISARLIDAMGGTVGVTSEPGHGSRFWFRVPLDPCDPPPASAAPREAPPLPALRVLLAEDSILNQKVVTGFLSFAGHSVAAIATNGHEAVELAAAGGFDLILMDMHMPFMDGLAAARAIRALPGPEGRVPIVALTANALAEDAAACLAAGMNGHVAKPIDTATLFQAISNVIA